MATLTEPPSGAVTLTLGDLDDLLAELRGLGYETYGPQVHNGVIVNDVLRSTDELPVGWTDEQSGGHYRLVPRVDGARFGYAVGPQSWKELLHPARSEVWSMERSGVGTDAVAVSVRMHVPTSRKRAFVGVRPCELAAIAKQDRVLLDGPHADPTYGANRSDLFVVAVNCGDPAETCFCTSMATGPAAGPGHDLAVTELVDGDDVLYVVEVGSEAGASVLAAIDTSATTGSQWAASRRVTADAADRITRRLDANGIKDLLYDNLDSPLWDQIADTCLTCGNCTLACPTCFCTDLQDVTDLSGDHSDRWRIWDSCFSLEYSHLGPGPHRETPGSRYRQWMTHKLATWFDQFDESGCVGCGRCITWCPVGIDITIAAQVFEHGSEHGATP